MVRAARTWIRAGGLGVAIVAALGSAGCGLKPAPAGSNRVDDSEYTAQIGLPIFPEVDTHAVVNRVPAQTKTAAGFTAQSSARHG